MKQIAAPLLAFTLLAAPVSAQDQDDGLSLMEEGTRLFLRGLMSEMEPMLQELDKAAREAEPYLREFMLEMGPALGEILEQVDDWTVYHAPEMLENGDIIIRRKVPLTPEEDTPEIKPAPKSEPKEKIDL